MACSALGANLFPYGNTNNPDACVIGKGSAGSNLVRATGGASACQGGIPGLYEMLGNVHEWADRELERGDGGYAPTDNVSFVGGAWGQVVTDTCLTYTAAFARARNQPSFDIGVRCCADPQ
jgi:formylglycine-generating enzyme